MVRPRISSVAMLQPMASSVFVQLSRMPNEKCPISRIAVMKIGGMKRFSIVKKRLAHESRAVDGGGLMVVGELMRVPSLSQSGRQRRSSATGFYQKANG